jgi:predicted MFS family arabinose efflux permease
MALFVGMLNPALLPAAYALSSSGPTAFTQLEICLIGGSIIGSVTAGRIQPGKRPVGLVISVWLFAAGVFAVGLSPSFLIAGLALAISGVGNLMYSVANTSALMEAAVSTNRGVVMSARFTVTQASNVLGLAIGGAAIGWLGPLRAFSGFGLGLLLVAAIYTAFLALQAHARRDSTGGGRGFARVDPD